MGLCHRRNGGLDQVMLHCAVSHFACFLQDTDQVILLLFEQCPRFIVGSLSLDLFVRLRSQYRYFAVSQIIDMYGMVVSVRCFTPTAHGASFFGPRTAILPSIPWRKLNLIIAILWICAYCEI